MQNLMPNTRRQFSSLVMSRFSTNDKLALVVYLYLLFIGACSLTQNGINCRPTRIIYKMMMQQNSRLKFKCHLKPTCMFDELPLRIVLGAGEFSTEWNQKRRS